MASHGKNATMKIDMVTSSGAPPSQVVSPDIYRDPSTAVHHRAW